MKLVQIAVIAALLLVLSACDSSPSNSARGDTSGNAIAAGPSAALSEESATQGTNPVEVPVPVDPSSPNFVESDPSHFKGALLGVWFGEECSENENAESNEFLRNVYVFTESELIETEYVYSSEDCTGTPFSYWYPLPIRTWQLGNYRALADGSMAWELDTAISQRGVYAGKVGDDKNTTSYVNIGFVNGQLEMGTLVSGYKTARPENRSGRYFNKKVSDQTPSVTTENLLGTWFSSCSGRLESTYEFFADTLIITDENWANTGCEGDSYAARKTTFSIIYGDVISGVFENKLQTVEITALSNELIHFDASQELEEPEFKVAEGRTEFRAVTIENDTLILGYCLNRNSGDDNCQDEQSRIPDMVDYNWLVRFEKLN